MANTNQLYRKVENNQPMKGYDWIDFLRNSPRNIILYAIPRNKTKNYYLFDKNYTIYIYSSFMSTPKRIEEIHFEEVDLYDYLEMSDVDPLYIEDTPLARFDIF